MKRIFLAWLCFCSTAQAGEFLLYNPRAIGMAGAYTALATGADALAWNPAGLSLSSKLQTSYSQSGFYDDSRKMGDDLDPLRLTDPNDPFLYTNSGRTANLAERLAKLDGQAAHDFRQTSYTLAGDKWALSYANVEHWLLIGSADTQRIRASLPDEPDSIARNQTAVDAVELRLRRYTAALSFLTPQDPFMVGVAIHHSRGGTRNLRTRVFDLLSNDPKKLARLVEAEPEAESHDWSCDLGLIVPRGKMRYAAVARNLFFNKFPVQAPPPGAPTELGPGLEIRLGAAYAAEDNSLATLDLDLTNNRVLGAEPKSRSIAIGYERWVAGWLALRSGTARVLSGEPGFTFSLGTSVRLGFFSLDVGGRINRNGGFDEIAGGATMTF